MIYLDNNATTQPSTCVVDAMLTYMRGCYFNASASTAAFTGVEIPRREAAAALVRLLNAEDSRCFSFTSGATESNNWVFSSFARELRPRRVIISAVEHPSVTEPANALMHSGIELIQIPVDDQGVVRLDALHDALNDNTVLVSIIAANNETGVIEPIAEIGQLVRECSPMALFHTDATQAVGKIDIDLQGEFEDVDLLSFSAHKFHGPKGIGGLYSRPGVELKPMLLGGGQEHGVRSGTTNTPALAGLAAAVSEVDNCEMENIRTVRNYFEIKLRLNIPDVIIHSQKVPRLPNTSNFSIPGMDADKIAIALAAVGIITGTGAACSSGAISDSRTLRAMGLPQDITGAGLRVSLSRSSRIEDVDTLLSELMRCDRSSTDLDSHKAPPTV